MCLIAFLDVRNGAPGGAISAAAADFPGRHLVAASGRNGERANGLLAWTGMIYSLTGTLAHKGPDFAVVECGGVGYQVHCGARHLAAMPHAGAEIRILTHLVHREDAMLLLGFASADERDLYLLLGGVNGVGPKLAMAIVGTLGAAEATASIVDGAPRRLTQVRGVGPKLAQGIVLELKDRLSGRRTPLPDDPAPLSPEASEAELALLSLGYTAAETRSALGRMPPDTPVEEAIRRAISVLSAL